MHITAALDDAADMISRNLYPFLLILFVILINLEVIMGTVAFALTTISLIHKLIFASIGIIQYLILPILADPSAYSMLFGTHLIYAILLLYSFHPSICNFLADLLGITASHTYRTIFGRRPTDQISSFTQRLHVTPRDSRDQQIDDQNQLIGEYIEAFKSQKAIIATEHAEKTKFRNAYRKAQTENTNLEVENRACEEALAQLRRMTTQFNNSCTLATKNISEMTRVDLYNRIFELVGLLDFERRQHSRTDKLLYQTEIEHDKTKKALEKLKADTPKPMAVPKSHKKQIAQFEEELTKKKQWIIELEKDREYYVGEIVALEEQHKEALEKVTKEVVKEYEEALAEEVLKSTVRISGFIGKISRQKRELQEANDIKKRKEEEIKAKEKEAAEKEANLARIAADLEKDLKEKVDEHTAAIKKNQTFYETREGKIIAELEEKEKERFLAIRQKDQQAKYLENAEKDKKKLFNELKATRERWEQGYLAPDERKMLTPGGGAEDCLQLLLNAPAMNAKAKPKQKQIEFGNFDTIVTRNVQPVIDFTELYKSASKSINDLHTALTARRCRIHLDPVDGTHPTFSDLVFEQQDDQAYAQEQLMKIGELLAIYVVKLSSLSWMGRDYKVVGKKAPPPSARLMAVFDETFETAWKVTEATQSAKFHIEGVMKRVYASWYKVEKGFGTFVHCQPRKTEEAVVVE